MTTAEVGQLWQVDNGQHSLDSALFVVRVEDDVVWCLPFRKPAPPNASDVPPEVHPRSQDGGIEGHVMLLGLLNLQTAVGLGANRTVIMWLQQNEVLTQAVWAERYPPPLLQLTEDGTIRPIEETAHVWAVVYRSGGWGATFSPENREIAVERAQQLGGFLVKLPVVADYTRDELHRSLTRGMAQAAELAAEQDSGHVVFDVRDEPRPESARAPRPSPRPTSNPPTAEEEHHRRQAQNGGVHGLVRNMLDEMSQAWGSDSTRVKYYRNAHEAVLQNGPETAQELSEAVGVPEVLGAVRWCLLSHDQRLEDPRWQEKDMLAATLLGDLAPTITALRPKLDPELVGEFVGWCRSTGEHEGTTWAALVDTLANDYGIA